MLTGYTGDIPAEVTIVLEIPSITNQASAKDAGEWSVTTHLLFDDGDYYQVDTYSMPSSFTASTGTITASGAVQVTSPVTYGTESIYTITITAENAIPPNGYIVVYIPPQIGADVNTIKATGTCTVRKCTTDTNEYQIVYLIPEGVPAGQSITLEIGGLRNPRSIRPSDAIVVITMDPDGTSQIDSGFDMPVTMTIPADMTSFDVQASAFTNGETNTYTFSIQQPIPLIAGDRIVFTMPDELAPPADSAAMACAGVTNINVMVCEIAGRDVIITFADVVAQSTGATYSWRIANVGNPYSTEPSSSFTGIKVISANGFDISVYPDQTRGITNKFPAQIQVYSFDLITEEPEAITEYTLTFTPINGLPQSGSIQITYPEQIVMTDGDATQCRVKTFQTFSTGCTVDSTNRIITIVGVFPTDGSFYSDKIVLTLINVRNPVNNKNLGSFTIKTFGDVQQQYNVDQLDDQKLFPRILCDYPCATCDDTDRSWCLSCWMDEPGDPMYLMSYGNSGTCKQACDLGYSSNAGTTLPGEPKVCQQCDESCVNCLDEGVLECIDCNRPLFPFRLTQTNYCFSDCGQGLYQSTAETCSRCKAPCFDCEGSESHCTICDPNSDYPALFENQCLQTCPKGYTNVGGVCVACASPCAECDGAPDRCLKCDGVNDFRLLYDFTCWDICPSGTTPDNENSVCIPCTGSGCALCQLQDTDVCLKCEPPLYVHEGVCVAECPAGFRVNDDNSACRTSSLADLGILYFPWLIAATVLTLVCLFGLMRRREVGVKGQKKAVTKSFQHTISCITIVIAPIQTLATNAQYVLAILYGTTVHAALAIAVACIIIVINLVFMILFCKDFRGKTLDKKGQYMLKNGTLDRESRKKHMVEDKEPGLAAWARKHKCLNCTMYFLMFTSSWKWNKLVYCNFYDYAMFRPAIKGVKTYRNRINWFGIVAMVTIDLLLICVGITGLLHIEWGNQLYINMIETVALSVISIILNAIELKQLKDILEANRLEKEKKNFRVKSGYDEGDALDYKERKLMMKELINKVKGNQHIFLNNKLDELLDQFGDRKCKSMIDLPTGWPVEEDPRKTVTWPISPAKFEEYKDVLPIKFTAEDAYGMADNCYAEGVEKHKGKDMALQGDAAQVEFQDALNRKHGDLMTHQEDTVEEQRRLKGARRRGRKNKYHAQIDAEDDEEAEAVEASDDEAKKHDLQVIKEQEEEEEALRKMVAAEAAKQAAEAQALKEKQERDRQSKLAQDKADEEARKQKQAEDEAAKKAAADAEAKRKADEEAERAKLKAEADADEKRRAEEQAAAEKAAKDKSEAARLAYEQAEAERLAKEKADAEAAKQAEAEMEIKKVQEEQDEKTKAAADKAKSQADKDAADLAAK